MAVRSGPVDRRGSTERGLDGLTPRQGEVLALVAEGHSNAAIARRLSISEKAVVRHLSLIYAELHLRPSADKHRRVLAARCYLTR